MNGFPGMRVEANERVRPIGEMVSRGQVKFEAKENVWKNVEVSNFPIFYGVKIKTHKGLASIAIEDDSQIEVGKNSLLYFDQDGLHLDQGQINFRISPLFKMSFIVGNLTVTKHTALQAGRNLSTVVPANRETMGSISIHSNGSVTIKSVDGRLSILDKERKVLSALSSRESVTIPSTATSNSREIVVAQAAGPASSGFATGGEFLGMSAGSWGILAGGVLGIGGMAGESARMDARDRDYIPICP
jgi:hypothetical protein